MAPVKNQCSGDYFYGGDLVLEKRLQGIEGDFGRAVSEISVPGYKLHDEHKAFLKRFWMLQHVRTEAASRRTVSSFADMESVIGSEVPGLTPSIKEAVQMAMRTFDEEAHVVDDLKVCLIRNRSTLRFITSDDPAVMTNLWHAVDPRPRKASPGLISAGMIFVLPLTPTVACVGYDGDVYAVAHENGWVHCRRERDAAALNELQYLNCAANIYFREWLDAERIPSAFSLAAERRVSPRHRVHYAVYEGIRDGARVFRRVEPSEAGAHERALVHIESITPVPGAWPSFLRRRSSGTVFATDTGVGFVRKAALAHRQIDTFRKVRA
jgi:hypothetical protein